MMESSAKKSGVEDAVRERFEAGSLPILDMAQIAGWIPTRLVFWALLFAGAAAPVMIYHGRLVAATALAAIYILVSASPMLDSCAPPLQRRIYLLKVFFDGLIIVAAAQAAGLIKLGLIAAVANNIWHYSAISFLVEIPAARRQTRPDGVIEMNRAFFGTLYHWTLGSEIGMMVLAFCLPIESTRAALWTIACLPALLVPQWIGLWRNIAKVDSR